MCVCVCDVDFLHEHVKRGVRQERPVVTLVPRPAPSPQTEQPHQHVGRGVRPEGLVVTLVPRQVPSAPQTAQGGGESNTRG